VNFLPCKQLSTGQRTHTAKSVTHCVIWYHLACQSESSFKNLRLSVPENWQVTAVSEAKAGKKLLLINKINEPNSIISD
jgi:hypothetical protein